MTDTATTYLVTVHYDGTIATHTWDVQIDWTHPDYFISARCPSGEGPWRRTALRTRDVRSHRLDIDLIDVWEIEDGDWLDVEEVS